MTDFEEGSESNRQLPSDQQPETDLGFVLDLLSGARPDQIRSVRARQRCTLASTVEGVEPKSSDSRRWWQAPDYSRAESDSQISVDRGLSHWRYEPSTGKATSYSGPVLGSGWLEYEQFERRLLTADLEVIGDTVVDGRAAVAIQVTAPEGNHAFGIGSHSFSPGQSCELALDRESGMILRNTFRLGGLETELHDLVLNEDLPDELFQSPIPADAIVAGPGRTEQEFFTDLPALRAAVVGPLVLPTVLPDGSSPSWLSRETIGPLWQLQIRYQVWPGGQMHLSINQGSNIDPPAEFDAVEELDGVEVQLEFAGSTIRARRDDFAHPVVVVASSGGSGDDAREVATAVARGLVEVTS